MRSQCLSHAATGTSRLGSALRPSRPARPATGMRVLAQYNNEAEGLYGKIPLQEGIINKRLMQKQMGKDNKAYSAAMKMADDEESKEKIMRREARGAATSPEEVVEYFLNTVEEDMEFEVARNMPKLNAAFFKHVDNAIGALRFSGETGDEDTMGELEALRNYLTAAVSAVDKSINAIASAKERVSKLLSSKDKKECILQMVEDNEIDQSLMDLLQTNIVMAREAEQEDAAKFMEKVLMACAKYYVTSVAAKMPAPPPSMGGRESASAAEAIVDVEAGPVSADAAEKPLPTVPKPRRSSNTGISRGGIVLQGGDKPSSEAPGGPSKLILPGR